MKNKKKSSWVTITIFIIIFWPIGLYLLFKRFNNDKTALFNHSKGLKITSYILIGFGLISILMTLTGQMTYTDEWGFTQIVTGSRMIFYLVMSLMFIVGGIILFNKMQKVDKESARYKRYISLIINNQLTDLSEIASSVATSTTQVTEELQKMIDEHYLPNAYIDRSRNKIVFNQKTVTPPTTDNQLKTYVCSSCGAKNELYENDRKVCEYCGNALK